MKMTQAVKSYNNPKTEGWVTKGTIFNVGREHRPGLPVITATRAKQCVDAKLHIEYREGDAVLKPDQGDPIVARQQAYAQRVAQQRQDNRRQTKVDPPPSMKGPPQKPATRQEKNPPQPRRVNNATRQSPETGQSTENSTNGGPTGATPDSQSSSQAAPAAKPSIGTRRGMRRGDQEAAKRAGLPSTRRTASSRKPTPSTAPTGTGGDTGKDAQNSED